MGRVLTGGFVMAALVVALGCGGDDDDGSSACPHLAPDVVEDAAGAPVSVPDPLGDGCTFVVEDDADGSFDLRIEEVTADDVDVAADQAMASCEDDTITEVEVDDGARAFACMSGQPSGAHLEGDTMVVLQWSGGYDDEAVPLRILAEVLPSVTVPT